MKTSGDRTFRIWRVRIELSWNLRTFGLGVVLHGGDLLCFLGPAGAIFSLTQPRRRRGHD